MVVLLLDEVLQQSGHKACAYVLECEGRTMKQLKCVDVILYVHHRTVELQCVVNYIVQSIRVNILSKECACHCVGNLLKAHLLDVIEKLFRQLVNLLGHVQSAIFCQSLNNCFVQVGNRGLAVCAIVLHIFLM